MNMQWMRRSGISLSLVVGFLAALPTALHAQSVRANWRLSAPFSTYKTYEWVPSDKKDHPFYRQFVDEYVNYALTKKKHLEQVSASQSPDLLVRYHFLTQEQMDTNTTYMGMGGGWGGWGMGGWGMGGWGMGMGMGGMGYGGMGMGMGMGMGGMGMGGIGRFNSGFSPYGGGYGYNMGTGRMGLGAGLIYP